MSTGKATSRGITAVVNVGGSVINAYIVTVSENDEAQVDELKDGFGEVQGLDVRDRRRKITVDLYPAANSLANVQNTMNTLNMANNPVLVNISGTNDASTKNIPSLEADWVYSGGATRSWSEGQVKVTLPLWRSLTGANANVLTTAVT